MIEISKLCTHTENFLVSNMVWDHGCGNRARKLITNSVMQPLPNVSDPHQILAVQSEKLFYDSSNSVAMAIDYSP